MGGNHNRLAGESKTRRFRMAIEDVVREARIGEASGAFVFAAANNAF
jgi:hypothetical protein